MYRICTCERAFAVDFFDLFVCCVKLLCELIEEAWDDLIRGNGVLVSKSKSQNISFFFFGSRTD